MRRLRLTFVFFSSIVSLHLYSPTALSAPAVWDLNDVSFLLPLPADIATDAFLFRTNTMASAGELLPAQFLKLLPVLIPGRDQAKVLSEMRVVGIRIDPCFPVSNPQFSSDCRSQIRMVWQPVVKGHLGVATVDTTLHSFYELQHSEFLAMVNELTRIRSEVGTPTTGLPLSIHPTIVKQGLGGTFWTRLSTLFLKYTGGKRLSRITFMDLQSPVVQWNFGGIEIVAGTPRAMSIPRVSTKIQTFINTANAKEGFNGGARPSPQGEDTFNDILDDSSFFSTANAAELKRSVDGAFRIENPKIHNPNTVDCVSCHTAQPVRVWATTKFPDLDLSESRYKFKSAHNLANQSPPSQGQAHIIRAFGYFNRAMSVSQRTINETAVVAETLNSWLRKNSAR